MIWTLGLGALVLAGCGGPAEVKTTPVSGTVYLNDQPLEGAAVTFVPDAAAAGPGGAAVASGGVSATGVTDASGKFTLKTGQKEGAAAGKYQVAISKMDASPTVDTGDSKEATLKMADTPMVTADNMPKSLIPEKYASPATSGFSETVEADKANTFEFKLTE